MMVSDVMLSSVFIHDMRKFLFPRTGTSFAALFSEYRFQVPESANLHVRPDSDWDAAETPCLSSRIPASLCLPVTYKASNFSLRGPSPGPSQISSAM